jgi:1,4-dihydroxy-2-naphthoyl-CoA hydrolase
MNEAAEDFSEALNGSLDGWNRAMGLRFVRASKDEVIAEIDIGESNRQAYGIVHGGTYAGAVETVASVGAALNTMPQRRSVVGLENTTSFIRAVREGIIRITAKPLTRGRRTHVWEAVITDAAGHLVATGRVRLLVLEGDVALAGKTVELQPM